MVSGPAWHPSRLSCTLLELVLMPAQLLHATAQAPASNTQ